MDSQVRRSRTRSTYWMQKPFIHTQRWRKTRCMCVSESACLCSWVWTRLQLRRGAMAIPSDLKTGSPATLKSGGERKCQRAQRRWKFKGWDLEILESGNRHTHIHTGEVMDYGKEQVSTPLCSDGSSERKEGKMRKDRENGKEIMRVESEHG